MTKAAVNTVRRFRVDAGVPSSGQIPRTGAAGPHSENVLSSVRHRRPVPQRGCTAGPSPGAESGACCRVSSRRWALSALWVWSSERGAEAVHRRFPATYDEERPFIDAFTICISLSVKVFGHQHRLRQMIAALTWLQDSSLSFPLFPARSLSRVITPLSESQSTSELTPCIPSLSTVTPSYNFKCHLHADKPSYRSLSRAFFLNSKMKFNCLVDAYTHMSPEHLKLSMRDAAHHPSEGPSRRLVTSSLRP